MVSMGHQEKAHIPIVFNPSGRVIFSRLVQWEKAPKSIVSTLAGISIAFRLVQ